MSRWTITRCNSSGETSGCGRGAVALAGGAISAFTGASGSGVVPGPQSPDGDTETGADGSGVVRRFRGSLRSSPGLEGDGGLFDDGTTGALDVPRRASTPDLAAESPDVPGWLSPILGASACPLAEV
jgi:hypothetical protein